jgi:membrane-associated protease RseP (regulator of RpoE activity)
MWDGTTFHYDGRGKAVPFVLQERVPIASGAVDGTPGMFEIDTGAEDSLTLNTPFVKENDIVAKYSARLYGFAGEGVGGRETAYFVRVHTFQLAGIPVHSIVTELSQDTAGVTSETTFAGIVGIGVLKRFNVVLDYRDCKMYLEKNRNYSHPNVFNRAGFAPRITAEGLKVASVFQNSPASEAGIVPGDLIVSINGRLSHDLDVPFLYMLLRQKPGTLVRLKVLDHGLEKNVEIRLRDLL